MLKQQLSQKLIQKLSPQQIQLMKLIQLPTQALEQRIKEELEANPALEEAAASEDRSSEEEIYGNEGEQEGSESIEAEEINVDEYLSDDEVPDYRLKANNYSADDEEAQVPLSGGTSFTDYLLNQISTMPLSNRERQLAEYLIGSIDEEGYLRRELRAVVDDLAFGLNLFVEETELEEALKKVQLLDPPGVGARDLRECLLLQLQRRESSVSVQDARLILANHFVDFTKKHYDKIVARLELDEDRFREALDEIVHLNPKPGNSSSQTSGNVQTVIPDFSINVEDGALALSLNGRNAPELNVSREYRELLDSYKQSKEKSKAQKDAVLFVKQKLDGAKWFIEAIRQRQQTLLLTMSAIMNYQKEYFLTGDERNLKPMILKDIADEIGMDISTVSRVASNKYVATPYGTFLIKDFFSESMKNEAGEDVSTREIKRILLDAIEEENKRKPLTDEKLAKTLKEKGYPIARRTVAKYREQLDIPVARLRKEF